MRLAACEEAVKAEFADEHLTTVVGSYWYQADAPIVVFDISGLTYDSTKPVFAAVVPTQADGTPVAGGETILNAVSVTDGNFRLPLSRQ